MKIATSVVHAPWVEDRIPLMAQLRELLAVEGDTTPAGPYQEETIRGRSWIWQHDQFQWFARATEPGDWCLVLQDDQRVPSHGMFFSSLLAMAKGCGHDVICLHAGHPAARTLYTTGSVAYTTSDGLVGQGFAMTRERAVDYLAFRANEIVPDAFDMSSLNVFTRCEDNMIALYCMTRGLKVWHPLPTIVDHDLTIPSTNEGNDEHMYRSSQVTWLDAHRSPQRIDWNSPDHWAKPATHLGLFYSPEHGIHRYAPLMLRDRKLGEKIALELAEDIAPPAFRKYFHRLGGFG